MDSVSKSLRLHLVICGRINAGKSSLLNLISGQDIAITSPRRGTTSDVVEKTMELRPLGAVVVLDTAGIDDNSALGDKRLEKTAKAVDKADAVLLTVIPGIWDDTENTVVNMARERNIPLIVIANTRQDSPFAVMPPFEGKVISVCAVDPEQRTKFLDHLTATLIELLPESKLEQPFLHDLLPADSLAVLMTPIDSQAPKGRLIMPEVMAIRDILDGNAVCIVAKEDQFPSIYEKLTEKPALVVCDSQVVHRMINSTSPEIRQTTFSILMSRLKGDINEFAAGCAVIEKITPGDKILIAEACTHHADKNDIGKVQIPQLLEEKCGGKLNFNFCSGTDFPADIASYRLIVHCGGCMLNRRAMLNRLRTAARAGVPVCNYGMCIASCRGVIEKVLSPFPEALAAYRDNLNAD